jgi:orotidine-5'-phosphate decarboxylase
MTGLRSLPTRSLIPACDVEFARFTELVAATADLPEIGAYKIGAALGLAEGLPRIVETIRARTTKPVIYDHQKAGTDIPDTGTAFMKVLADAGVNAVILFPFAGPTTEQVWIRAGFDAGLEVIVGAHMTHPNFLEEDNGFLPARAVERMYRIAAASGVSHFVVPGNKPAVIEAVRDYVSDEVLDPTFYAPGFVAQGGEISDAARAAGARWHAIVGRGLYESANIRVAAEDLSRGLA